MTMTVDVDYTPAFCVVRIANKPGSLASISYWIDEDGTYESYIPSKSMVSVEGRGAPPFEFVGALLGISGRLTQWIPGLMLCPEDVPDYAYVDKSAEAARFADRTISPPARTVEFAVGPDGLMSAFAVCGKPGRLIIATAAVQRAVRGG
ncbi:MAG: hypothetical protein ABIF82_09415 [Planctomycetota bacterium]